jgi:hypothetical protein
LEKIIEIQKPSGKVRKGFGIVVAHATRKVFCTVDGKKGLEKLFSP